MIGRVSQLSPGEVVCWESNVGGGVALMIEGVDLCQAVRGWTPTPPGMMFSSLSGFIPRTRLVIALGVIWVMHVEAPIHVSLFQSQHCPDNASKQRLDSSIQTTSNSSGHRQEGALSLRGKTINKIGLPKQTEPPS